MRTALIAVAVIWTGSLLALAVALIRSQAWPTDRCVDCTRILPGCVIPSRCPTCTQRHAERKATR